MRGEIIALDLETTGLDPDNDRIIEIGMARFRDGEVIETYDTLIDPQRELPPHITSLTGIKPDDLIDAPKLAAVLDKVSRFIGSAPVLGHNVGFDLSFLQRAGIAYDNQGLDTYELASVMLPTAPRYNLNSLTQQQDIVLDDAHRALADATATARLYWSLWEKVLALPLNTLQEIVSASRGLDWTARYVFEAALEERARTAFDDGAQQVAGIGDPLAGFFGKAEGEWRPLRPNAETLPLDPERLAKLLGDDGLLAQNIPGYEHRLEQIDMLRAVVSAFNDGEHLMVEAGTGTGKSIAYLIPAIYWALQNNERVVISTNTINLQDQLINKDIPLLREALGVDFKASVLKGRGNYLCPRRLANMRRRQPTTIEELRVYAKVLIWLLESTSGDRGELNLRGNAEIGAWLRLSAEDDGCTLERCHNQMHDVCPFYQARRQAESAHLVVVNHALLLSDVAVGSRVLPPYHYVILDEGHHLEDATTNGLSFRTDKIALRRQLADLGGRRTGVLGDLLNSTRNAIPDTHYTQLVEYVQTVEDALSAMDFHINRFFDTILHFLEEGRLLNVSDYMNHVRVTDEIRARTGFQQVRGSWDTLGQFMTGISAAMSRLAVALNRLDSFDIPNYEDVVASVGSAARLLEETHSQLKHFSHEPDANTIYWVQVAQNRNFISIHSAPLHVGPLIEQHLWSAKESVVLTSATLQTAGAFDYVKERLHAHTIRTLDVGSPFNYRDSTLVYIPTDIPEPNDRYRYQDAVEEAIIHLAAATGGRLLGLFTSYAQLRKTAQAISPRLALGNISVFDQSDGTSRQALLDGFKSTERAVLLGTRSFWEGVDIPGDDLLALAIARLPFAVPTDPIFAARSETFENSFAEYAVPDAILRFRQGFGRLIRTKTDRGIVVILDRRVVSKGYGRQFLDSLPACTVQRKPLADLPQAALEWLSQGTASA
ncbi:MAG: DEAD/DEAH box helicase [Anaerolineae bacterium]|nr:DEAD/DEAH box helicase [Anaerolineae bacterium]